MDLLKEITEDYSCEIVPLMEAISQSVKQLHLQKRGGKVSNKMIADFIKSNPKLTTAAAIDAMASYEMYKTNKRNTVSLFAKDPYEKRMISKVVDSMTKSGKFKLHRCRYADGGKYYELKQIKIGF
jgi:hypothetical protein